MLTVDEKRTRLAEIRAQRNTLTAEVANFDSRAYDAPEARRAGYEERRERLNAGIANLDEEQRELQAEVADAERRTQEIHEGLRNGTMSTENGDGARRTPDEEPARGGRADGALRAIERHADLMADGAPRADRAARPPRSNRP
jgi:predicted nuclease with TOPRIM domain